MTLHVLFTKDGIPGWIGDQPREGSEPVEGLSIEFLAAHRRTAKGDWVKRVIAEPVPPTAEEIAALLATRPESVTDRITRENHEAAVGGNLEHVSAIFQDILADRARTYARFVR